MEDLEFKKSDFDFAGQERQAKEETMIEKNLVDAKRRYQLCEREMNPGDLRQESNPLNAARGFRTICDLLFAVIAEQRREIERLERESARLVKPQPKGVKAGPMNV